jgi:segregation and condensation protein B
MSDARDAVEPAELLAALEAVLFAAGEPVAPKELAAAFDGVGPERIEAALEILDQAMRERRGGLRVERVAGGFRLATDSAVSEWVRRFFRQRNRTRLSPASLEALAIIAYRQPVTAPEIQAIRGVDSSASLKSLLDRKLIRVLGRKKVVGSPLLYGTSKQFLVHFGLDRLQDLPPVDAFAELLGGGGVEASGLSAPVAAQLGSSPMAAGGDGGDEPEADRANAEEE